MSAPRLRERGHTVTDPRKSSTSSSSKGIRKKLTIMADPKKTGTSPRPTARMAMSHVADGGAFLALS